MRTILHLDMDAFYASVELRDNPALRGKPVAVGGTAKRGVLATASYEARKFGVHSAMPTSKALALCPQLIVLPGRHALYAAESRRIFAIFHRVTPLVEGLSLDEAFLDVTASRGLFGDGASIARKLKDEVARETGLTVSAGVATSKFVAKIASDLRKPDGLVVAPDDVAGFLAPLPIEKMWGVGSKTAPKFHLFGLRSFGDLARADPAWLVRVLGDHALHAQRLARGEDDRPVVPVRAAKSVGAEQTFEDDVQGFEASWRAILAQLERVVVRLLAQGLTARTWTLKLRDPSFATHTLRCTASEAVFDLDSAVALVRPLLERVRQERGEAGLRFRLVGVSAGALEPMGAKPTLFVDAERDKRERLEGALGEVRRRLGVNVTRATLLRGPGSK